MMMRVIYLEMTEMRKTILSTVMKMSRRIYPCVKKLQVSRILSIEMQVKDMDCKNDP